MQKQYRFLFFKFSTPIDEEKTVYSKVEKSRNNLELSLGAMTMAIASGNMIYRRNKHLFKKNGKEICMIKQPPYQSPSSS